MSKPYRLKDPYFLRAKRAGLRARSAFKIAEIIERFGLVRESFKVLDLGAAPGGFLEILAQAVGPHGLVLGIDIVSIRPLAHPQVKTAVLDVLKDDAMERLAALWEGPFDAVISDLAPKTSGIKTTDAALSHRLAHRAWEIAQARGRAGSNFVVKIFMGGEFEDFCASVRRSYRQLKIVRPEASRAGSREVYLVAIDRK